MSRNQLLKIATRLVGTHGFTRRALAESVLALPKEQAHPEPLSDLAVSAVFGKGDDARRTLINAWLDEGISEMKQAADLTVSEVLRARLKYNEPALHHLPELCRRAFALLASSNFAPLDPIPALKHTLQVADTACHITNDKSVQLAWYSQRATLAAVYGAAELSQLTSPVTAPAFLDSLLEQSRVLHNSVAEVGLFSSYVFKSWKAIGKSKGFL